MKTPSALALLGAAILLSGCAQYATVTERRCVFHPSTPASAAAVSADARIAQGEKCPSGEALQALGDYLSAAQIAAQQLAKNPQDTAARDAYNFALSRVFTVIRKSHLDPWTHPLAVPSENGGFILKNAPYKEKIRNPALYEFTPADQFDVNGTYVSKRTVKPGLGAALVVVGKDVRTDADKEFALSRTFYGITAVARFEGRNVIVDFQDPLATETTTFEGHDYPLAADFTVPLAVMLARENPKRLELARALRPGKFAETAHIVRLQPYDPNKTVVIFVHGLMDSPATWTPMLNDLRGDAEIRRNFQFWFYSYPSGYPYPYSAAIMRQQLDSIEKKFPLRKPMVVVGHSMGSMITRLMITDADDKIWMKLVGKPPEQVSIRASTKELLEESLIFHHRPEIGRVIFISGPHRGSDLASNWIGRIASSLIHAPSTLLKAASDLRNVATLNISGIKMNHIPNSVDTLSPNSPFVKAVNEIPVTPGIPFHSIMGDRGRGDTPNSSDGVVPYWSSHMEGAQSELIVPAYHPAHQNPMAIAEVKRILLLHARVSGQAKRPSHSSKPSKKS